MIITIKLTICCPIRALGVGGEVGGGKEVGAESTVRSENRQRIVREPSENVGSIRRRWRHPAAEAGGRWGQPSPATDWLQPGGVWACGQPQSRVATVAPPAAQRAPPAGRITKVNSS